MSAKRAIIDKLEGNVAAYLRCDGVVINQIKKGLLQSLRVKKNRCNVCRVLRRDLSIKKGPQGEEASRGITDGSEVGGAKCIATVQVHRPTELLRIL